MKTYPLPSQHIEARIGNGVVEGHASEDGKVVFYTVEVCYYPCGPSTERRAASILDWRPL